VVADNMREFEYTWDDFNYLRKLSNEHSGIMVPDDKFDMFYSRLSKRLRFLGFSRVYQYCQFLQAHPELEFTEFMNAVTTNLTSFFRETHHFDYLVQTLLPDLKQNNPAQKQIKVWSAGCSTGEEPYSLAMILLENMPADWNIKILATDLDTNVLSTAAEGIYPIDRVSTMEEQRLHRWFQKGTGANSHKVRTKDALRQIIQFKQLNLMQEWPMKGGFDFIFCRNVLIYFDRDTKSMLANRYASLLREGGHLFIGHAESLHLLEAPFSLVGNTIYKKYTL
jgi:chemotaxis protein methyltransferase CheR